MKSIFILISFMLYGVQHLNAQELHALNGVNLKTDSTGTYTFIVSGHFYGDGTNSSGYPANTLLANLSWINQSDACMLVCLGDLFMDIKNDLPKYRSSLFDVLEIPLVNAVGNHDLTGTVYQDNFGTTSYYFQIGSDLHVVLDTEMDNGDIEGEQLDLLAEVAAICERQAINNVFVYAHRTIWKETYPELEGLFTDNTQSITATNYESEVLPIARKIAAKSNLYWFAGSIGNAPASFFYFKDDKAGITYIATAIRALLRDAILIVRVNNEGVRFETHSLTGQDLLTLEQYNVDFWKSTSAEDPFNYRLVPLYIKNAVLHRYFWYGMGFALLLAGLVWFVRKRRKSRT